MNSYPAAMPAIEDPCFFDELGKFISNIKGIEEKTEIEEIEEIFPELKEIPAGEEIPSYIFDVDFIYDENSESISYIIENYDINDLIDFIETE